jgi:hypothetical protein
VKPLTLKFPYVWPNERSFKRKKIFIQWRSHWRGSKLVEDAKDFFSDGLKNLWNSGTGASRSRRISLKSKIRFISVYLQ